MVDRKGRCPRCGGDTSIGEGMVTQVVYDEDGVIWVGDIGTEYCTGGAERTGCQWSQMIGDVDAFKRAEAQARRSAQGEVERDY